MKKVAKWIVIAIVALAVVICVSTSVYTVAENEYACVVRFEKIVSTTDTPGLHFKMPFIDGIKRFPKAVMLYDISPSEVPVSYTHLDVYKRQAVTLTTPWRWRVP